MKNNNPSTPDTETPNVPNSFNPVRSNSINIETPNGNHSKTNLHLPTNSTIQRSRSIQISPGASSSSSQSFNKNPSQQSSSNALIRVEKKGSQGALIFQKGGKDINFQKAPTEAPKQNISIDKPNHNFPTSHSEASLINHQNETKPNNPSIQKRSTTKEMLIFEIPRELITVEELEACDTYENNEFYKPRLTRGYISLQNYLKEMKEGSQSSGNQSKYSWSKKSKANDKKKANDATLIDTNTNSYTPSIFKKRVDLWDNESQEAFEMHVNQGFNRLTNDKIQQVIKDLLPSVNTPERQAKMINIFVSKAKQEKNFAPIYAEFVKVLEDKNRVLFTGIISKARDIFQDSIWNPVNTPIEIEMSAGITAFIAAMIQNGCIPEGTKELEKIINALPDDATVQESLIEMLFNFVKSVGNDFLSKEKIDWTKLDHLIERKDIPSRIRFMLIDIKELINGKVKAQAAAVNNNETLQHRVRSGYASFQDNDQKVPNEIQSQSSTMTPAEFLTGSMEIFPDFQRRNIYDYTYYQCFILKKLGFKVEEVINILKKYVRQFATQKLDTDCPQIWENISNLLCQMIINEILKPNEAKLIHEQIFYDGNDNIQIQDDWDPINDLKYFIQDNYEFNTSLELRHEYATQEICEALKMPSTINRKLNRELRMSRFIAMAVVRSAFAQLRETEDMNVNILSKWKAHLQTANNKQPRAFHEAIIDEFNMADYPFAINDIYTKVLNTTPPSEGI